jgi:hypothetical protein
MTKYLLNKVNLKLYSDSICSRKNRILRYANPDGPIFAALVFGLDFFHLGSLIPFSFFFMPQNALDLQIIEFSTFHVPVVKIAETEHSGIGNRMVQFFQSCQIWSSTAAKDLSLCNSKYTFL